VGAFAEGGVLALVPERPGPRQASKLTEALAARIVALEATGLTLLQIAEQTDVSTATVRVALGWVTPRTANPVEQPEPAVAVADSDVRTPVVDDGQDDEQDDGQDDDQDGQDDEQDDDRGRQDGAAAVDELGVLACPVPRTAERAAARAGDLLEAPVVITQGAHLPLAGLLLVLPALQMTGLLEVVSGPSRRCVRAFMGCAPSC